MINFKVNFVEIIFCNGKFTEGSTTVCGDVWLRAGVRVCVRVRECVCVGREKTMRVNISNTQYPNTDHRTRLCCMDQRPTASYITDGWCH